MKITTLPYWGQINSLISDDSISLFTTKLFDNNQSLAKLYRLDSSSEHPTLTALKLPVAMDSLCAMPDSTVMLIGRDGHLYQSDWQAKKISQVSQQSVMELSQSQADEIAQADIATPHHLATAVAIQGFSDGVAVLYPNQLLVWSYQKHQLGECIVNIRLDSVLDNSNSSVSINQATTLSISADGEWVVIGDSQGVVSSFQFNPERTALLHSSSEPLHQGAVTALCFEPIAQQFFSAGADKQLLRTHAQGKLQGIDRGKASQHSEMIRAMVVSKSGANERLYTGSDDKSIKAWQFDKGQPNTCKEDLVKIRFLALSSYVGQASIVAVGTDQSLRFVPLDNEGKLTEVAHIIKDGYQRLTDLLGDKDDKAFQEGLALLGEASDNNRLNVVTKILDKLTDGYRSEQLATWLATSNLPKTIHQLEQLLAKHGVEKVRAIAFTALKNQANDVSNPSPNPLRYLQLALDSKFVDVNEQAIAEYVSVAQSQPTLQPQIIPTLQDALSHREPKIRKQALSALETLLPSDSPRADLLALATGNSDVQQAGLIRLYQRGMMGNFEVKRQLVILQNDTNAVVRQTAFYVAVLAQPLLADTLAKLDDNLTRTLQDFNDFRLLPTTKAKNNAGENSEAVDLSLDVSQTAEATKAKTTAVPTLDSQVLEPLLQGLSNQYDDISFRAAYALALLHDERAFGALLRLMHDPENNTRIGVAKALGELGKVDGLTVLPLLLDDSHATVRQVAMQAYGKLSQQHGVSLLDWASVGFESREQDIHQQALSVLLSALQNPADSNSEASIQTLTQALNDPFEPIRQEVVKVLINRLSVNATTKADSTPHSQQQIFALLKQSNFVDVHQVALDEWQTLLRQAPTASDLTLSMLAEFLASPFDKIREGAFTIAEREYKRIPLATLLPLAFASPFVATRQQALNTLSQHKSPELMPLITALFNDENSELRLKALDVAMTYGDPNVLTTALQSPYSDIQLAAAQALARKGNEASYDVFERFLSEPMPELADEKAKWHNNIIEALWGLVDLADKRGFAWFDRYVHDTNIDFSKDSRLLSYVMWVSRPANFERLVAWQTDERAYVKQAASLALAVWGDKRGEILLKDDKQANTISDRQWLQARVGLGVEHAKQLAPALKKSETALAARLMLAFYDLLLNPAQPKRLVEALAIADSETALFCAGVIARYADPAQAWQYIADTLNQQLNQRRASQRSKNEAEWAIDVTTLQRHAQFLVFGVAILHLSSVGIIADLQRGDAFDAWRSRSEPFLRANTESTQDINADHPLVLTQANDPTLHHHFQALAFGAWLGILRQTDYSTGDIAQQAINALLNLAKDYPNWQDSVQRAFIPLLNHQNYNVRELAWQGLQTLGMPDERLGEQAMSSPHLNMVQKGLALWLGSFEQNHSQTDANAQLQQLLQTNSQVLTLEAYRLLVKRVGALTAGKLALDSYYLPLRSQVVNEWQQVATSERQADKLELLTYASNNDDWQTRFTATSQLFNQSFNLNFQPQLIDRAIELWQNAPDINQQHAVNRLLDSQVQWLAKDVMQATPQVAQVNSEAIKLLTLLDSPQRKVELFPLYRIIGNTRNVAFVPELMQRYVNKRDERTDIVNTITKISGFDQVIEDYDDDWTDRRWLERQYPRHVDVLLTLAQFLLHQTDYPRFTSLLDNLAWAGRAWTGKAQTGRALSGAENDSQYNAQIDQLLQRAYIQAPNQYTVSIVKAMAYRADKRQGDITGLRKALSNKDSEVQFLAAEGLAKRGNKDGFAVLMATIDYNSDGELRRRAVLALGELADEQSYDKLIKLADDLEHYLQDVASEALGHLGQTEYGQRIFTLLKTHLEQADAENPAIEHWLNGLRWLNTYDSWQQIRAFIERAETLPYTFWSSEQHAIKVLQYHPATDDIGTANRELLLKLIRTSDDDSVIDVSVDVAKKLFGNDNDQVYAYDWAVLVSVEPTLLDNLSLNRVSKHANLDELLTFISDYPTLIQHNHPYLSEYVVAENKLTVLDTLSQAVLERGAMPASDLQKLLTSHNPLGQQLGLRYLTQHPQDYWQATMETSLWQQLAQAQTQWQRLISEVSEQPSLANLANRGYQPTNNAQRWQDEQAVLAISMSQLLWLLLRFSPVDSSAIVDSLAWLIGQQRTTIVQAIPALANTLNDWLKQALLALLARPVAQRNTAQPWHDVLRQVDYWSNSELEQLAHTLLAHVTADPIAVATAKKPTLIERVAGLFGKHDDSVSSQQSLGLSPSQQLIMWVKQNNITALYQWASDSNVAETTRISAIEGLGQLPLAYADDVVRLLTTLQQTDADPDIGRTAFSTLRRYQRRMTPKVAKHSTSDLNVV